ncbi:MAG: type II secretion protein F [Micavibrio sp. TMED27]|nr:type II secretion protein F [Micavibrio sp.]OUT89717.1 MAG: type II secretion protein F [Micavibrio sp. TMED27]|tara:strand:+ start:269 stop:1525 length:1257 start_codon:yes stop_codon:yes gene_type:complete
MHRYKYRAINAKGRPIRGAIAAANEVDLYKQLQTAGLELVDCSVVGEGGKFSSFSGKFAPKIGLRDVIQFFVQMEQMQGAGVPLLDALADVRDATENQRFMDIMTDINRDVSDGAALSEAMNRHPKVFPPLYISLIEAGEETGDLTSSYRQLIKYLKWVEVIQTKVKKATRYPMVVTFVVLLTITFMMSVVVPQIVGFLKYMDMELPWFTVALINTSNFFVQPVAEPLGIPIYGGFIVLAVPVAFIMSIKGIRASSDEMAYKLDSLYVQAPVFGPLIRKISIARYAQTFGALYASGIDVIKALEASRGTVSNLRMIDAMENVEAYVQAGNSLSKAFDASGEFPSLVVRMVKIGEESGNLTPVLDQVSDFYTHDVNEAIDGMIEMIQPTLTAILGLTIAWIAAGSLGPIYMNLGNFMDF